jgi:outer membrane lipoprotein-sorting protein
MNAHAPLRHRRSLRWLVPVGVVAVIGLTTSGVFSAAAAVNLPPLTAAQLLASIEQSDVVGLSGTIVSNANLGLPQLPDIGGSSIDGGSLTSLLTGSNTIRVWYGGPEQQRVALLESVGETDVFRNGTELWEWSSSSQTATHVVLPAAAGKSATAKPDASPSLPSGVAALTPAQLAQQALAAIDPSTVVSTDANRLVAGRPAYELVLTPRDTTSLIGSVHIAIDGQTKIPVAVQIYPRGVTTSPAMDVSFTQIDFTMPAASNFTFTAPKNAAVTTKNLGDVSAHADSQAGLPADKPKTGPSDNSGGAQPTVLGKGWTSVVEIPASGLLGANATPAAPSQTAGPGATGKSSIPTGTTAQLFGQLTTPVSGAWGSGRLFQSKLITALITDDGRAFIGAVDPAVLYAAAATPK